MRIYPDRLTPQSAAEQTTPDLSSEAWKSLQPTLVGSNSFQII